MLIGIDGNEANVKKRVGVNVYAFQVLKHLEQMQNAKCKMQNCNLKFKIYMKEKPLTGLPQENNCWQYKILKPQFLWTQWRLPLGLFFEKEKPDVFFTPSHYAPRFSPTPTVISIMDLAFLRFSNQFKKDDLYQLVNWTKYSVKKASHILTISEFTKREIVHFYKYPKEKITVTYPGVNKFKIQNAKCKITIQNLKTKYGIKDAYFIYIGTLQPRKNLTRLIKAFNILISQYLNIQLVIVGKKGWLYDKIFEKAKDLRLENKVIFTGFISEKEKYLLLKNALAFVLPSLYEGFGIPVSEAMQAGCPVIVSNTSSLPEAAGEAAEYIKNPESVESIYNALLKMVKLEEGKRKELINKGFKHVKKFSWEKCVQESLRVLKKTGGGNVS